MSSDRIDNIETSLGILKSEIVILKRSMDYVKNDIKQINEIIATHVAKQSSESCLDVVKMEIKDDIISSLNQRIPTIERNISSYVTSICNKFEHKMLDYTIPDSVKTELDSVKTEIDTVKEQQKEQQMLQNKSKKLNKCSVLSIAITMILCLIWACSITYLVFGMRNSFKQL